MPWAWKRSWSRPWPKKAWAEPSWTGFAAPPLDAGIRIVVYTMVSSFPGHSALGVQEDQPNEAIGGRRLSRDYCARSIAARHRCVGPGRRGKLGRKSRLAELFVARAPVPQPGHAEPALISAVVLSAAATAARRLGRGHHGWPGRSCPGRPSRQHALRARHGRGHRPHGNPAHRGWRVPALPDDAEPAADSRDGNRLRAGWRWSVAGPAPVPAAGAGVSGPGDRSWSE